MPATSRKTLVAAGVLLAIYFLQGLYAMSRKSPTFDETGDIAAGLSYVQHREVRANLQHPPLMKHLAGTALWLAGMRLADTPAVRQMLAGQGGERAAGSEFLTAAGVDRALAIARLPFLLCATLLGWLIWMWGRELAGEAAALCSLLLYTLDPNVMAHGYLATMDMGLAAFATLFCYALWRYLRAPGTRVLLLCGLAMGLMLAAKFSGLFLLPVAAVWLATSLPWRAALRAFLQMAGIAAIAIQTLYLSPGGLFLYATGIGQLNQDHDPGYLVFLAGQLDHRFVSYFAVAWLLKEPLATLLLCAIGVWAMPRETRLILLLPPAAILAGHSLFADNLGVRYLLPAFPFAYLTGGIGAAWLLTRKWGRPAAAAVALWLVAAAIAIYPDPLSYFNEAARGELLLDDSNADWGQGLKQLSQYLNGRPVHLAYFGSYPPTNYIPNAEPAAPTDLSAPGLYAISAHFVARNPSLLQRKPIAIVGHALYIYQVP